MCQICGMQSSQGGRTRMAWTISCLSPCCCSELGQWERWDRDFLPRHYCYLWCNHHHGHYSRRRCSLKQVLAHFRPIREGLAGGLPVSRSKIRHRQCFPQIRKKNLGLFPSFIKKKKDEDLLRVVARVPRRSRSTGVGVAAACCWCSG